MRLVDHHQVPASRDQVLEAPLVVGGDPLPRPAAAPRERLHAIERTDHLVSGAPDVVVVRPAGHRVEVAGVGDAERLPEVELHLRLPLGGEPLWRDDEDALRQAAKLELADDETRLDRLAESDLVREQVTDVSLLRGALQRVELVRQRGHAGAHGREQDLGGERLLHARRGRPVHDRIQRGRVCGDRLGRGFIDLGDRAGCG